MPSPCWVPKCKSNYRKGSKVSVFSFPSDEETRQAWISAIKREDFAPTRHSRVCAKHFREEDFLTVSEAYNDKTGEFIRMPLKHKRILPGAVPSIFPNSPSFTSSEPSNTRENPDEKGKIKEMEGLKARNVSLQEQVKKEECETFLTIQEAYEKLNAHQSDYLTVISNKSAIILLPLIANQASTTISGTESQNVAETSIVIKQEPTESVDEPPRLVIENIHRAEEMASFSCSSSLSSSSSDSSAPVPENSLPFVNPDSTNVDETPAAYVPNKPAPKRKLNYSEPDEVCASPISPLAKLLQLAKPSMQSKLHPPAVTSKKSTGRTPNTSTQAKLCRRTIPSMSSKGNSKLHPPARTSKKTAGRSTLPTNNGENASTEVFQSLVDGSENNPLFSSRATERPGDLFDVFADFIGDKLREMDWDDCAYALRAILDVVFKAGKVQHDSEVE